MMKSLACADFGGDCHFVAEGNSDEEVMQKMWKHIQKDHPDKMEDTSKDETMKMMKTKIKTMAGSK